MIRDAGKVLRSYVHSQTFNTENYPPSDNFLKDIDTVIPKPVRIFLEEAIVVDKKGRIDQWNRLCTTIARLLLYDQRTFSHP